ncbi:hypothetical protein T492DRAFT_856425 [Pavlovales sp. CCMP2436]|nr:hypothetical protein T492DRAFT_856425 [Pavlovales sp. CCMP2436]
MSTGSTVSAAPAALAAPIGAGELWQAVRRQEEPTFERPLRARVCVQLLQSLLSAITRALGSAETLLLLADDGDIAASNEYDWQLLRVADGTQLARAAAHFGRQLLKLSSDAPHASAFYAMLSMLLRRLDAIGYFEGLQPELSAADATLAGSPPSTEPQTGATRLSLAGSSLLPPPAERAGLLAELVDSLG